MSTDTQPQQNHAALVKDVLRQDGGRAQARGVVRGGGGVVVVVAGGGVGGVVPADGRL